MPRHAVATVPGADLKPITIITSSDARELATLLGPSVRARTLQTKLNELGTMYRWGLGVEGAYRPKEMRKELGQLAKLLGAAVAKLGQLDDRARRQMEAELSAMLGAKRALTQGVAFTRAAMARLQEAAERGRAALPRGDKPGLDTLRWLCSALATVYETASGKRYTYDAHGSEFLSDGAYWIARVIAAIDPEVTRANLSTVLRDLRKPPSKN